MRTLLTIALGLAAVAAVGCGGTTSVEGKVSYQGKPVAFGSVVVIGTDNIPKSGAIQPDGGYRVSGVKPGPVKLGVSSPPPPGAQVARKARLGRDADDDERRPADEERPASPEVLKAWFPLPGKYADPTQSGLTADVRSGQPVNLELK
jgi:hypothetical protein